MTSNCLRCFKKVCACQWKTVPLTQPYKNKRKISASITPKLHPKITPEAHFGQTGHPPMCTIDREGFSKPASPIW